MLDDEISVGGVSSSSLEMWIRKSYLDEFSIHLHETETNKTMNGRLFKNISNNVTVSNPSFVLFGKNLHVPVITLWWTW